MVYNKADLVKKALAAIKKHKLVFIEEVVAHLPCSKPTYYKYGLDEVDDIKEALESTKIALKSGIRDKMYKSDNATAWIAFYKLLGTDDEADRLNGARQKVEHSGETSHKVSVDHRLAQLTDEELLKLKEINKKIAG